MKLDSNVRIGAQLYINPTDSPQKIRNWVRQMDGAGFTLIRLFLNRSEIERIPDQYDFSLYDPCFDEAARYGIGIVATLSPATAPGYMKLTTASQDLANIDDPEVWDKAMAFVRETVRHYKGHAALDSWILWNEPSRGMGGSKDAKKALAAFIRARYQGDIRRLNRLYYQQYESFDELSEDARDKNSTKLDFQGYVEQADRDRFTVFELNRKLSDIRDNIVRYDKVHPIHINPHNVSNGSARGGQAIFEEGEIVDFLGCSAHPVWHSGRFGRMRYDHSVAMYCDLMASAGKAENRYFWVTELQGGTTLFSSPEYYCPTPQRISHWMWESIGSGAKAVVFWCFNIRDSGNEGGEWGLLNQAGKPSGRLLAAKEVAEVIAANKALFARTVPKTPEVLILFPQSTFIINELDAKGGESKENPRNRLMGSDAVCGAYLLCTDLGIKVGFVDEKGIQAGLPQGTVLIAPSCTALEPETVASIKRHVENGGLLIADGLFGYKDANGYISEENRELYDSIFGANLEDIVAIEDDAAHYCGIPAWFARVIVEEPSERVAAFQDNSPAIFENKLEKGLAIRITTLFFQYYFASENNACLPIMESLLRGWIHRNIYLTNPSKDLRCHILPCDSFHIVILLNKAETVTAQLAVPDRAKVVSLLSKTEYASKSGCCRVELQPHGIEVLHVYQ